MNTFLNIVEEFPNSTRDREAVLSALRHTDITKRIYYRGRKEQFAALLLTVGQPNIKKRLRRMNKRYKLLFENTLKY